MIEPFWAGLLAKMIASAAIVVLASVIVERSGPFIGALVATLPVSAGPAYVYLSLDHGPDFIARSSLASLAVCAGTPPLVLAYGRLAPRFGLATSLGCALGLWLAVALLANQVTWSFWTAVLLNVASFAVCLWLAFPVPEAAATRGFARRWWDLPLRALTVMTVAGSVILAGRLLGPGVAGVLALIPVVLTSLAIVLQPRIGGPATATVMLHSLPGMVGFTLGVAVLHVTVVPFGTASALLVALGVCIGWNLLLFAIRQRRAA